MDLEEPDLSTQKLSVKIIAIMFILMAAINAVNGSILLAHIAGVAALFSIAYYLNLGNER